MKKLAPYIAVACIIVVIVLLVVFIPRRNTTTPQLKAEKEGKDVYPNSSVCQPCSSVDLTKKADEILDMPHVAKVRSGRSVNPADACKRYDCSEIIPICFTHYNTEAKQMEDKLNKYIFPHEKCENVKPDSRGKMSKKGLPNFIYMKTKNTDHHSFRA